MQVLHPVTVKQGHSAQALVKAPQHDKGSKSADSFEVWHHHQSVRQPAEWALMMRFDRRR